jgi:predicted nucleotidyltransferase
MSGPLLDRAAILAAFALLDRRLARRDVHADVYVVGGAAMALAWDARRSTRDVDALFLTDRHQVLLEEIWAVADELDLPRSWLNEQATMYAPADYRDQAGTVFDGGHLRVMSASARIVLAMKCAAMRPSDIGDILTLVDQLGLQAADDVVALHASVFPDDPLPPEKTQALEAILADRPGRR